MAIEKPPDQIPPLMGVAALYRVEWMQWIQKLWRGVNRVLDGTGSPEGVVTAPVGTLYIDTAGGASTTLFIKESGTGNTGWRAV